METKKQCALDTVLGYDSIIERFPVSMSKDDFYKVAHISKKTAEYLLKTGAVPCEYSGKKTRCFTIRTQDVLYYLSQRELEPEIYAVPAEWYREGSRGKAPIPTMADKLSEIADTSGPVFRNYIEARFATYDDLLSVREVAEVTGYCTNHINNLCRRSVITAFQIRRKYYIPKVTLIDYLVKPAVYRRYSEIESAPRLARDFLFSYHGQVNQN